jgi:hypothetical protein
MAKRIRPGHVVEIRTPQGLAYAQYLGEHHKLGGTLWVIRSIESDRPVDLEALDWENGYHVFYPARAALRQGFVEIVGEAATAGREVPSDLRRPGARDRDGALLTWIVTRGGEDEVFEHLSYEDQQLPLGVIWNHEMLVQRLVVSTPV